VVSFPGSTRPFPGRTTGQECGRFFGMARIFCRWSHRRFFAPAIEETAKRIVPSISLREVFKRILPQRDKNEALGVMALMMEGRVVNLDSDLAIRAGHSRVWEKASPGQQRHTGIRSIIQGDPLDTGQRLQKSGGGSVYSPGVVRIEERFFLPWFLRDSGSVIPGPCDRPRKIEGSQKQLEGRRRSCFLPVGIQNPNPVIGKQDRRT